jgi:transcriptional regulator with XRE-family HTH domain
MISDKLRRAARRSGATPNHLANLLGVSQSTVVRFLAGGGINSRTIDRLARLLGARFSVPMTTTLPQPGKRK